jgi:hypothetical protein
MRVTNSDLRFQISNWVLVLGVTALAGCAHMQPVGSMLVQSPIYATPATDLFKRVQAVLAAPPISLQSTDLGNGQLLTDWQEGLRGDFHIVRYWHERTRYHITVAPDFTDASHRSRLQISDETQQRPDEGGINVAAKTWSDAPNIKRPERSEALLKQIETQLTTPAPIELPPTTLPAK